MNAPRMMSPPYRKIAWRLVPFLMLLYMVAFLDRVNISFAALTMNRDLGFSESVYGFAAIAGLILLGTGVAPTAALIPTALSVLIGAAFGYVSEVVAGALTKKEAALAAA